MRLRALNSHADRDAPWRGGLIVSGADGSSGALLDPTGALSARLLADGGLRRDCGLDGRTLPVLLTQAQLDQIAALIELRHGCPIDLYTTPSLFEALSSVTTIWPSLQSQCTMHWRMVPLGGDKRQAQFQVDGQPGVSYTVVSLSVDPDDESSAALLLMQDQRSGAQAAWVHARGSALVQAQACLIDHQESLRCLVLGLEGPADEDTLEWLSHQPAAGRILMARGGVDARAARRAGVVLAHDGMDIQVT